jgi:hypothetical protein
MILEKKFTSKVSFQEKILSVGKLILLPSIAAVLINNLIFLNFF